jgi:hypothetical protein
VDAAELGEMSWPEMLEAGLGGQVAAGDATISLLYIRDDTIGELLMGPGAFKAAVAKAGERVHEHHLMLLGIDGPRALGPLPRVFFVQGADTLRATQDDFVDGGGMSLGRLEGAFRRAGLLLVEHALDVSAPFQIGLGRCCGDPPVTADYVLHEPIPAVAAAAGSATGSAGSGGGGAGGDAAPEASPVAGERSAYGEPVASGAEAAAAAPPEAASPAPPEPEEGPSPLVRVLGVFLLTGLGIGGAAVLAVRARARATRGR